MFANRISQTLHEEHGATIELMERLESMMSGEKPRCDPSKPAAARSRRRHRCRHDPSLRFRGTAPVPLLESVGDQLIGDHLTEEHNAMRPLGGKARSLCGAAQKSGFDAQSWQEFQRAGAEFVQRMLIHVQKEEMALLPLIDGTMDSATETRLCDVYAGNG